VVPAKRPSFSLVKSFEAASIGCGPLWITFGRRRRGPAWISGDAGFSNEANLAELKERCITGYLAPGLARHGEADAAGRRRLTKMPLMSAMAARLKRAGRRSRYRLRKQVVEPVFGQIKQARGFRQFVMRGLDQVWGEWAMICTAHNLLKLAQAGR